MRVQDFEILLILFDCLYLTDMIKKGDTFWAVSTTTIGCTAPLKNVITTDIELPENEKAEGASRNLKDALQCPQKSTVKGKIVQVSFL